MLISADNWKAPENWEDTDEMTSEVMNIRLTENSQEYREIERVVFQEEGGIFRNEDIPLIPVDSGVDIIIKNVGFNLAEFVCEKGFSVWNRLLLK